MSTKTIGSALTAAAVLCSVAACSAETPAGDDCVVRIGSIFSQTGAASVFGVDGERAIALAVEDVNAEGFEVDGRQCTVEYRAEDLASDPTNAAALAQDLINGFGAHYIFGPDMAAAVPPVATAVQRSGTTMLLSVSTGMDDYTGQGEPFFRLSPPDGAMVSEGYIPAVAAELDGVESIAVLMNDDETGRQLAPVYAEAFAEAGIETVRTEYYDPGSTNFSPIVRRIDRDSVDALFIGYNNDGSAAAIMDAALEAGLPGTFITRGISAQPGVDRADQLDAYTWLILGADPLYPADEAQSAFVERFTEHFGIETERMTYFPFVHYDYVGMLVQAMQEAGTTTDVEKVSEALRGAAYEGVVQLSFDDDGINTSPMAAGFLRDGDSEVVLFGGN